MISHAIITPDWPAPENIRAVQTTRTGGCSQVPFDSLNLALHVGDSPYDVQENRKKLTNILPSEPIWLDQVHSDRVINAQPQAASLTADGSYTDCPDRVCAVMTADCLPVLICNRQGTAVAAVHAGWRGLVNGIIEQAVKNILTVSRCQPQDVLIWLGPAIGPQRFEVGPEVRQEFIKKSPPGSECRQCFTPTGEKNKWFADIYQLARQRLLSLAIENISGGTYCTYNDNELFYSYRRDATTGRMASLIWIRQ